MEILYINWLARFWTINSITGITGLRDEDSWVQSVSVTTSQLFLSGLEIRDFDFDAIPEG